MDRNIILLFGGDSDERLVSVASAQFMAASLDTVKPWFWHPDGSVHDVSLQQLLEHKDPFTNAFKPQSTAIFKSIEEAIASSLCDGHVFLLGVHGGSGENGCLQQWLEKSRRPYTGSNAQASKLAFDKIATKEHLKNHSIKMAPHLLLEKSTMARSLADFFISHGETIVKPVCGGSSLGCFFIKSMENIATVVENISKLPSQLFLAEKVIRGREFTVGVIEDQAGPMALSVTEIVLEKNRKFDYQGKYLGVGTKEITPANLEDDLAYEAKRLASKVHQALALDGYSRADMILFSDGFYFLETNTLPGLSKQSLVPQQLAAFGMTMRQFLNSQIDIALCRRF